LVGIALLGDGADGDGNVVIAMLVVVVAMVAMVAMVM